MDFDPNNLHPLPTVDLNSDRQRRSIRALNALLKNHSEFLLRDERVEDYGVDAKLEIVVASRATNFYSQVQIKSAENVERNLDTSVSKSVPTANFNYLLNGTSPLYFLYSLQEDLFWYTWANDENRRLNTHTPNWKRQGEITLRFNAQLNDEALAYIFSRIAKGCMSRRAISDELARCALSEDAKFSVNQANSQTSSGAKAYSQLISVGLTLASTGQAKQIQSLYGLLTADQQRESRILLVVAYAYFTQGRMQSALASCGEARIAQPPLSPSDLDFLGQLQDGCDLQVGRIERGEYSKRHEQAARTSNEPEIRLFEAAKIQHLTLRDNRERAESLEKLRALASLVASKHPSDRPLMIQTQIHLALAEGLTNHFWLMDCAGDAQLQKKLGFRWLRPDYEAVKSAHAAIRLWRQRSVELTTAAAHSGVPWLHAEAKRIALLLNSFDLNFRLFQKDCFGVGDVPSPDELSAAIAEASDVIDLFVSSYNLVGELHTKITLADLQFMQGDAATAVKVAKEAKKIAEAMGIIDIVMMADAHIAGQPILPRSINSPLAEANSEDEDVTRSNIPDEVLDDYAITLIRLQHLPPERLEFVRRDVQTIKQIAGERVHWCKHIDLFQDLRHGWAQTTAFATDPTRFCRCRKYRLRVFETVFGIRTQSK